MMEGTGRHPQVGNLVAELTAPVVESVTDCSENLGAR